MTAAEQRTRLRLVTFGRLSIEPPDGFVQGGPRPRRLALLAILATRGSRGLTRERLLAILWPDSTEERGRHALSQTLYALRHDLGVEVVRAGPLLALDSERISSDVGEFEDAVAAGDWARAASLYVGPFAEGFSLADAPGFDEWLDEERRHLTRQGHDAIEAAAREAEAVGDFRRALPWRRRLAVAEPLSTRHALAYVQSLLGLGDRAGALEHARAHADLVRRELDADPDPALSALVRELKTTAGRDLRVSAGAPATAPATPPSAQTRQAPRPRSRRFAMASLVLLVLATTVGLTWRLSARRPALVLPVLAVGALRDRAAPDSVRLSGVLRDMLATNLARVSDLEIIAPTRLTQALPAEREPSDREISEAARRAGATEVLEGEVSPLREGLRLDLRRVDLRTGRVRRGYVITAADRFALIDSATQSLTRDLQLPGPTSSVADVTTRSPIAYRLYEEGLWALYQVDVYAAHRLFRAALAEDSSFALAAFYAWRSTEGPDKDSLGTIARRLAGRAPDRERLLLLARMATNNNDLSALIYADTLAARFPSDPDALIAAAQARQHRFGYQPEIVARYDRAIALDSVTGKAALAGARVGEALTSMFYAFLLADSSDAAERTLRRWVALQPANGSSWFNLSQYMEAIGRVRDAEAAYARTDDASVTRLDPVLLGVWKGINRGDPELLRQSCDFGLSNARDRDQFAEYRWRCLLAYRSLGRLREALALTAARRLLPDQGDGVASFVGAEPLNRRIIDFSMGRPRAAASEFLEADRTLRPTPEWPGSHARYRAWFLTLAATAFVAAGDTAQASKLVDSIMTAGARSLFGRDPLLHHFVRGLLLQSANRHAEAMTEFLAANYSWPLGYTRINLEYARCAMALGRPREAIYPLQAALRGGIEGPQLYVTRTELHELLAHAFAAAGVPDSARVHFRYVARMWAGADPELQGRHRTAVDWLSRHGGA